MTKIKQIVILLTIAREKNNKFVIKIKKERGSERVEEKIKATVGVFAGIINEDGKLLLRRRTEIPSIIPGKSFKGCWELPGGGVMVAENMPYSHLVNELKREVDEEVGIPITVNPMPPMYPVFFGKTQDLALVVPVETSLEPTKEETKWVSLDELNELAREYEPANKETGEDGQGIVSGYGKRMHCLILRAFSFSHEYGEKAEELLVEIQKNW